MANKILISPSSKLTTSEDGKVAQCKISLSSAPKNDVTIHFTSSDETEGTLKNSTITFTPTNWKVEQTISIVGVDDFDNDGDVAYSVTGKVLANGPSYALVAVPVIELKNLADGNADVPICDWLGTGGADVYQGRNGSDLLYAGAGKDQIKGNRGNDSIYGEGGDDLLFGNEDNDMLDGGLGDDKLFGEKDRDTLYGRGGNDVLDGGMNEDVLIGGIGNDSLDGGAGSDTLTGCVHDADGGQGEIDTLTGGLGADLFELGRAFGKGSFYDDGNTAKAGLGDYALITDFNAATDRLELDGTADGYYLAKSNLKGASGMALWAEQGATDELIAIFKNATATELTFNNTIKAALFV